MCPDVNHIFIFHEHALTFSKSFADTSSTINPCQSRKGSTDAQRRPRRHGYHAAQPLGYQPNNHTTTHSNHHRNNAIQRRRHIFVRRYYNGIPLSIWICGEYPMSGGVVFRAPQELQYLPTQRARRL